MKLAASLPIPSLAVDVARETLRRVETAGLVVTDPLSAPYSLVTHEYPPTLEIAKQQIDYLANTNHALHMHLPSAWEKGYQAGRVVGVAETMNRDAVYPPNPYKQETNDG